MEYNKKIYYLHFDTIDSTNTWAKKNAATLDPDHLTCITALEQTAGRGRGGRKWISPKGQNIHATLFFTLPTHSRIVANLSQILSLSCAKVLKEKGFSPQIKWPNDLLLSRKKVAGVLCETVSFPEYLGIVLGIGINLNMSEELLSQIDQPAISLAQLSGHTWEKEQILEPLLIQFLKDLEQVVNKGFSAIHADYEKLLIFKGETISCRVGGSKVQGVLESIQQDGRLNLRLVTGELMVLSSTDGIDQV
jgi:BirA family biotin operon repressor/biotin-[acetyl-CoA-carboxylase] ligase